jgi:hypothetical protein
MPRRQPAIMVYKGDWLRDPELSMCAPATRGIWFDLLCAMDDAAEQGRLTGTLQQLAHVARCTADEMGAALAELIETRTAHVTGCNGDVRKCTSHVTVENRRMRRESEEREKTRLRVAEHRRRKAESKASNADVPSSRARSVAVAVARTTYEEQQQNYLDHRAAAIESEQANGDGSTPAPKTPLDFERWWSAYPRKVGKRKALETWKRLRKKRELPSTDDLVAATERMAKSPDWTREGGQYIPHPTTWLNRGGWEDQPCEGAEVKRRLYEVMDYGGELRRVDAATYRAITGTDPE